MIFLFSSVSGNARYMPLITRPDRNAIRMCSQIQKKSELFRLPSFLTFLSSLSFVSHFFRSFSFCFVSFSSFLFLFFTSLSFPFFSSLLLFPSLSPLLTDPVSLLDIEVTDLDRRVGLCVGSTDEVGRCTMKCKHSVHRDKSSHFYTFPLYIHCSIYYILRKWIGQACMCQIADNDILRLIHEIDVKKLYTI